MPELRARLFGITGGVAQSRLRLLRVLHVLLASAVLCLGLASLLTAGAADAVPAVADPALEVRVLAIAEELRCLVCQNETLAASQADLAVDLRQQIRIKLGQGQSQQQILDFMVERYGDFVLYRPPLKASTLLLWAGPFLLLAFAAWVLMASIQRRRRRGQPGVLGAEESRRARRLLADDAGGPAHASGAGGAGGAQPP